MCPTVGVSTGVPYFSCEKQANPPTVLLHCAMDPIWGVDGPTQPSYGRFCLPNVRYHHHVSYRGRVYGKVHLLVYASPTIFHYTRSCIPISICAYDMGIFIYKMGNDERFVHVELGFMR